MTLDVCENEILRIKRAYEHRQTAVPCGRYSSFNLGNLSIWHELQRALLSLLSRCPNFHLSCAHVLDVGCGRGEWLRELVNWGARPQNLVGIDLLPERIAEARELSAPGITFVCGSAHRMIFGSSAFDALLQSVVFSSILSQEMKAQIASEMLRVLKPGGIIMWYDFYVNNPRNPDVRGIGKKEVRQLFHGCRIEWRRITVVPPLSRAIGHLPVFVYLGVSALKLLCTHYLALIHKPSGRLS